MTEQGANPNPPAGWYPDPDGGAAQRWWDGQAWAPPSAPAAMQQPAKRRKTWLIVLIIVLAAVLLLVGGCAALVAFVFNKASDALDPANNTRTGLSDGAYLMEPTAQVKVNDSCSFTGVPYDTDGARVTSDTVTVVGSGPMQCGGSAGDISTVVFEVSGGVASIVAVE